MPNTVINFDLSELSGVDPETTNLTAARIDFSPYSAYEITDGEWLTRAILHVRLPNGTGTATLPPPPTGNAYEVQERGWRGARRGYVIFADVPEVNWSDPTQVIWVDKDTLDPTVEPEAAWWAEINNMVQSGTVDGSGHLILSQRDGDTIDAGNVVGPGNSDSNVATYVAGAGPTAAAVAAKIAAGITTKADKTQVQGLMPLPLRGVSSVAVGSNPLPIATFGGYLWGAAGTTISRSTDEGMTWATYATGAPSGTIIRIALAFDGEVVLMTATQLYRSTGWAGGSPTWTLKATVNGLCQFQPWSLNGDGTKFITTEYNGGANFADSRYGRISLDGGVTWAIKYDSVVIHGSGPAASSHLHGCEYDPWANRFYVSEGHTSIAGLYYSDDDGNTWARAAGMISDPSPTVIVATDNGLVLAADSGIGGLFGVVRKTNGLAEVMDRTWAWRPGIAGTIGFGVHGVRDPNTGVVYMGHRTQVDVVAPIITAGTPTSGALLYTAPTGPFLTSDDFRAVQITGPARLVAVSNVGAVATYVRGDAPLPGTMSPTLLDGGNLLGGAATVATSVALGPRSTTASSIRSVALGVGATIVSTQDSVAIGSTANADLSGVAIGSAAQAAATGVAIGAGTVTGAFTEATVVGAGASTTSSGATALGRNASAGNAGLAVGYGATAIAGSCTAIGKSALAGASSVAVGVSASTGALASCVAIGNSSSVAGGGAGVAVGASAASAAQSIAIGASSSVNAGKPNGVALGYTATVNHNRSVALGATVTTSADDQVRIAGRHFEMNEVTAPGPGAADTARLYVQDNGSGKTQLVVIFNTGASQVIATQP